ncbi:MAG: OmpA family protein [Rhodospirillaceae bacterium]|nr:OmpA family protein [Rhodospirillaceae bacterium]
MSTANEPQIIIIKKKKKGGHDAHHGGAWKVAYADFVTAMMAFFLLLWLLNVTTDDQRQGIADYFDPSNIARATSGSGGVLGGRTVGSPGQMSSPSSQFSLDASLPGRPEPAEDADNIDDGDIDEIVEILTEGRSEGLDQEAVAALLRGLSDQELGELLSGLTDQELAGVVGQSDLAERLSEALAESGGISEQALEEALAEREQAMFDQAERMLRQAIQSMPELQQLAQNLLIDQTPEGLRIQIVDQEGLSMFPTGSAEMYPQTQQLLELVAQVVAQMPQQISVSGHTDATPFLNSATYDNWDLSTDRANASRRAMEAGGLAPGRIALVLGKSDTDPLIADDPRNPRNRRISIVLLREAPQIDPAAGPTPEL